MATSLIKTLWARLAGKKSAQGNYYLGDHSRAAHTAVLYDCDGQKLVANVGITGKGKSHLAVGEQPDMPAEYAMTATGSAVPVLDLFTERARAETLVRMATMTLLDRVGGAVKALTERYPVPVRSGEMSKAEIHRAFQEEAVQVFKQAEAAEHLSSALVKLGDVQLATAMAEWAVAMKASAAGTKSHIEDPDYLAWLDEPEQDN